MSISSYESLSKHLDSSRTRVWSLPSHVTLTDSPLDWIFNYIVRMGCWCGLASGIVIGRLINEWRSTWCILRARTAKTRSCYQGGRKSQPSILVSVAPQNVWPTQKKTPCLDGVKWGHVGACISTRACIHNEKPFDHHHHRGSRQGEFFMAKVAQIERSAHLCFQSLCFAWIWCS